MNAEKALQIIKNEIYADGKEKAEAMRVIEEAVGKQRARKPLCGHFSPYCPNCMNPVIRKEEASRGRRIIPYCKWCGQKLDWSDEE